ncbi:MFS transporter [Kitasatospora sp. MAP5-34]|uniref:MFS transporter n=1 Tax=Kitasatospora sp. MAP5-34 TaxID=3035102 RepID=UPI0024749536|nr:MFS transporter [Kitasatospora sp. MAP5-34]MDH6575441.1 MFS family permease [Kitasatospora sp. MAP5-34]
MAALPTTVTESEGSGFLSPLRMRGFRNIAVGQLVSSVGNAMYKVAQAWLLAGATGANGTLIGLLAVFQLGPLLLLSGYGGWIADRYPRRRVLLITQSAQAALCAALAALAFLGAARIWEIYLITLASGLVTVADNPARQRFLTDLVGETKLSRALGLYTALLNIGQVLGPLVAGLIVGWAQVGWIFALDAVTFLFVVGVLLTIPAPEHTASKARLSGLGPGLREVGRSPELALTVAASAVVGSVGVQFTVTNTLMATKVFHLSATGFALLPTAVTVGCLIGALLAGQHTDPGARTVLAAATATGLTGAATALAPGYPAFVLLMIPAGAAAMFFTTTAGVCLQLRADPEVRGRVLSVQTSAFYGSGLVGALLIGSCAGWYGPRAALLGAGLLTMSLCGALGLAYRRRPVQAIG